MLIENEPPGATAEVLDELAKHMRLAPDFAAEQAAELADVFVAAVAHLEATLGLCLAPRGFSWRAAFDHDGVARTPVGPVRAVTAAVAAADGEAIPVENFTLDQSETRTVIRSRGRRHGSVDLSFEAGFGDGWRDTPGDLRRAVKMLAAHYYDQRHTAGGDPRETLYGVASLIQPWRPVRLTAGAGA